MTLPGGDRIKETSATSGTASFVLTGAVSGKFRAFPASLDGKHVRYVAEHLTAAEAESGFGVYTHATKTLTRLYRYSPTPGGAAVSFSLGGLHVACTGVAADFLAHEDTVDPSPSDNIAAGFLPGMEWLNTATPSIWKCVGDGVWVRIDRATLEQYDIIGRIASGSGVGVGLAAGDLTEQTEPGAGDLLLCWIGGTILGVIDAGNLAGSAGADASPSFVASDAATYPLESVDRLSDNVILTSHQASVVFQVPASAAAGDEWRIMPRHDGCTVALEAGGTLAPDPARLVNGGLVVVSIMSNAGTAPVVEVRGNVLEPPIDVGTTKTYDNDDSGQDFRLTSTSTQTFGAAATYGPGFYVNLFKETTGNVTIDGADADVTMAPSASKPSVITVKKVGTALIAFGNDITGGAAVLDAA